MRFKLTQKVLVAFALILLPIFITFFITYRINSEHLKTIALKDLTALAEAYEGNIFQFLEMSKRRAQDFSSDGFIREKLEEILRGNKSAVTSLNNHLIKNKLALDRTVRVIEIVSPEGVVLSSTEPEELGENLRGMDFFEKGRTSAAVSENPGGHKGKSDIAISSPIMSIDGKRFLGVLVNFIDLSELGYVLKGEFSKELGAVSWNRGRHDSMDVYIVNGYKMMLTESAFVKDSVLKQAVATAPVEACLSGNKETEGFYENYRGVSVAGASMCIPDLKWTFLVEVDKSEILAPLGKIRNSALVTALIVLGLMGIFLTVFLKRVVMNIGMLASSADEISRGNHDVSVPVLTKDETGTLAESFNRMAGEVKKRTEALEKSKKQLAEAQRISSVGNWDWNVVKNEMECSEEACRIVGVESKEFTHTFEEFLNRIHSDDRESVRKRIEEAFSENKLFSMDHRIILPDGEERIVHEEAEVTFNGYPRPIRILGTIQDITERKKAEAEFKKISAAVEQSINMVFITDINGTIEYVNPAFEDITGHSKEEATGKNARILSSGETKKSVYEELWNTIKSGRTWRGVLKNKRKNGKFYWGSGLIQPVKDEKGNITHFLAIQEDITEKMMAGDRIKQLVYYDSLTNLVNRKRFMDLVEEWISYARTRNQTGAMLLIDVDRFQMINDVYGHGFGDEVIREMAHLLETALKGIDDSELKEPVAQAIIGRLSGDEFAIFIPYINGEKGLKVSERLRKAVKDFRFMNASIEITVSTGVVVYPENGATVRELFAKADAAVYRAKEQGRDRSRLYCKDDHLLEDMHQRLVWKGKILNALEEDRFEAWIQPILDIGENKIHHYEALARMKDEDGNILAPAAFIETAERFDIINLIDKRITEKAMRLQFASVRRGSPLSFCINLSGKTVGDPEFLSFLDEAVTRTGADPSKIIFEITETAAVSDIEGAKRFLTELRLKGFHFALDDFGVGFTSFLYLRELNIDYVKIDGFFIRKLHENMHDQLFVKAIVDVARGMGIKTVAEFVENRESFEFLRKLNVDYAQGYYIGKPGPPEFS